MEKSFDPANIAIAKAAIDASCTCYFAYPITPQNEISQFMSVEMNKRAGTFIQSESEIAAINMVFGASAAGARVMTSSSSPGVSLMQEGISFLSAAHLPAVIVNVTRGGPGLGNIKGAQSDYFQSTKGGGHGDYKNIVLAPSSVQESYDLTIKAFDLADRYRTPIILLLDGTLGRMEEPYERHKPATNNTPEKPWSVTGCKGRKPNVIRSLYLDHGVEENNKRLTEKYNRIKNELQLSESYRTDDAEEIIIAFGTAARIAKKAVSAMRDNGKKIGLLRPITLWPLPEKDLEKIKDKKITVIELNEGQMKEDIERITKKSVRFLGHGGGWHPTPKDIEKFMCEANE